MADDERLQSNGQQNIFPFGFLLVLPPKGFASSMKHRADEVRCGAKDGRKARWCGMNKDLFEMFNTNSFVVGYGPRGIITLGDRIDEIVRSEEDLASGQELYREAIMRGIFKLALCEGEIIDKKQLKGSIWEYKVVYGGTILKVWATEDGSKVLPPIKSEEELERILKEIRE